MNGEDVDPSYVPRAGDQVTVRPAPRPQTVPGGPPRFLLDVHLGPLAAQVPRATAP